MRSRSPIVNIVAIVEVSGVGVVKIVVKRAVINRHEQHWRLVYVQRESRRYR